MDDEIKMVEFFYAANYSYGSVMGVCSGVVEIPEGWKASHADNFNRLSEILKKQVCGTLEAKFVLTALNKIW